MRTYVDDAVKILTSAGTWPPALSQELDLNAMTDDLRFVWEELSDLNSYRSLSNFLRASAINSHLESVGYRWIYHGEEPPKLFLRQLFRQSWLRPDHSDAFHDTYAALERELYSESMKVSQVSIITGYPIVSNTYRIRPGVQMKSFDFGITRHFDLLRLDRQSRVHMSSVKEGLQVIETRIIEKRGDGTHIFAELDRFAEHLGIIMTALRLSHDGAVSVHSAIRAHVSDFPLLPISIFNDPDVDEIFEICSDRFSREHRKLLSDALVLTGIRGGAKRLSDKKRWMRFRTASWRYSQAFRVKNELENIVDLVVALEGLAHLQDKEELRRRVALHVALVTAKDDSEAAEIYAAVQGAYNIRNTLVHGQIDLQKAVAKRLAVLLKKKPSEITADNVEGWAPAAAAPIREYTRRMLWAFARLSGLIGGADEWPDEDADFDALIFDARERQRHRRIAHRGMLQPSTRQRLRSMR